MHGPSSRERWCDVNFTRVCPMQLNFARGFQVQGMHMVVPRKLGLYVTYGRVYDEFDRNPYEVSGGASYYRSGTRSWRLNMDLIHIKRSRRHRTLGSTPRVKPARRYPSGWTS